METPVERIHEVLEVGVRAPLLVTRMLLPGMVKQGTGKILQISADFSGPHDGVGWVKIAPITRVEVLGSASEAARDALAGLGAVHF